MKYWRYSDKQLIPSTEKCVFHTSEVELPRSYHPSRSSPNGTSKPPPIRNGPFLKGDELQRIPGFCNFYRRIYSQILYIAKTFHPYRRHSWKLGCEQTHRIWVLIHAKHSEPVRAWSDQNGGGTYAFEAAASEYAIGAILRRNKDDKWHPMRICSKRSTETQPENSEFTKGRCFSIMLGVEEWRLYLSGDKDVFEVWTDHKNLHIYANKKG